MGAEVVYVILCDDVQSDSANPLRIDISGLRTRMRSTASPPFPLVRPEFCALMFLTGCQGTGDLTLRIVQADTGAVTFRTKSRTVRFTGSPNDLVGVVFRLRNCSFPAAGLYWVECILFAEIIARQRVILSS
jgi:hypothetical protein